jgi:hypothetical protein
MYHTYDFDILLIYFFIAFNSDLLLNYLSRQTYAPAPIRALKIYFLRQSIKNSHLRDFVSAANAGLTIVLAILVTLFLANLFFKMGHPRSLPQLFRFLFIAFLVGYLMDIAIYKTQLFGPTLNPFYKIAGAGFWGAMAFIFSILASYSILKLSVC